MKENSHSSYPLLSIIVPVYNVGEYLSPCLNSILAQTYENLEIILVNDGSTDLSGKICDEYASKDKRVHVMHQVNQGLSVARNVGLAVANGEYIAFVDSDDYVEPDMYEYLYGLIIKENASMAMCNICEDKEFHQREIIRENYKLIPISDLFTVPNWMYVWNKLYKKDLLVGTEFNTSVSFGEDELFNFELAKKEASVAIGNQAKYHYRVTGNPKAMSRNFYPGHFNQIILIDQCLQYAKQHNLRTYYTTRLRAKFNHISFWLQILGNEKLPDRQSLERILSYVRENWLTMVFRARNSLGQKCFLTLCCVNFPFAIRLYRLIRRGKYE